MGERKADIHREKITSHANEGGTAKDRKLERRERLGYLNPRLSLYSFSVHLGDIERILIIRICLF